MKTNWQTKKLGEICDILDNQRKPVTQRDRISGKYPYYGATGIQDYVSDYIFDEKLILIGEDGAKWGAGENTAFIAEGKYWVNNHAHVIRPHRDKVLDNWIVYFINVNDLSKHITGLTVQKLNQGKLREIEIPLPSLVEQKQILKILDEVFERVARAKENAEKNLKNAKDLFESYLKSVFTKIGNNWEEKNLGEVCEMINRGVSPKYIESKGLCVLNQKCIRGHKINFNLARLHDFKNKQVSRDKYIRIGDVLVNSTGTGTLGRVAQVRELTIEATTDSHVTIVRPMKNLFHNEFFGYGLIFIEKEIAKRGDGCGGQTELARNTLKNDFKISYPKSLTEQKSIVKKLDALSAETKKLEAIYKQKLANLEELKKSVLKKAFIGEL